MSLNNMLTTGSPAELPPVRHLLVLYNPYSAPARALVHELTARLARADVQTTSGSVRDVGFIESAMPGQDVAITMGGDGSILRAARVAARHEVPVLGVNFGKVGFLAEVQPEGLFDILPPLLAGAYWIERRVMIQVELHRGETMLGRYDALNEVVAARRALARVIRVRTYLNDQLLTTYVADGLIVSTPTGSTAYSLAAGGPILHPEVRNLIVQPICPHLSLNSALVLPSTTTVRMEVQTSHEATISIDGQIDAALQDGDAVVVRPSAHVGLFLRVKERDYFYASLLDRLHST
jgi:NAD+ kinase